MGLALRFTDANFEREVIGSDLPVMVDFWASWCPPCKMMESVVEDLATEYKGRLKVGKLHVDQNRRTANCYHIIGLPTLALFRGGRIVQRRTGAQSKAQLVQMASEVL